MILGDVCTRNCAYCAVAHGTPQPFDPDEPRRLAEAVAAMGLRARRDHVGGPRRPPQRRRRGVRRLRHRDRDAGSRDASVEVLIPDFKGSRARRSGSCWRRRPDILNHNLETVRAALPAGPAGRPLRPRARAAGPRHGRWTPHGLTKSGIMLGMGEEWDEARDLRCGTCAAVTSNILTLGQYLRPSAAHLPVGALLHAGGVRRAARASGCGMGLPARASRARWCAPPTTPGSRRERAGARRPMPAPHRR